MRIEQSFPSPIHGISTLAPRTRPQGYASKQVNFRSDPVNKLTRRPSSLYKTLVATVSDPEQVQYHSYERDGKEFSFIVDRASGTITCTVDDVVVNTVNLGSYNGDDLGLFTIEHDTYILNRDVVVTKSSATDANLVEKVSHINVTSAFNYGETVQVNIIQSNGTKSSVTYTIPELGTSTPDYDTADAARATNQVALELAARINGGGTHVVTIPNPDYDGNVNVCYTPYEYELQPSGDYERTANPNYDPTNTRCEPYITTYPGISGVSAISLGSSVAVWEDGRAEWLQVEIESGQGDRTTVAFNQVTESTTGLPLYAVVGTRIKVRPDPTSTNGVYYLQAERIADAPSGETMEEVVWSEDRSPTEQHSFDNSTMPRLINYDGSSFTLSEVAFKGRTTGDDDSVPYPEFVGNTLQSMGYFQKRLVVVSENGVYMTETEDLKNWFRQSAVQLLVTDTIAVTTSELGADKILHLVPHNKDLLCISSNAQFKIPGDTAITPQTVSMPLTTKYECQISVPPTSIGNSIYFPIDYGDSTGVQEYTGERDTSQDFAAPVTNHIIGYLTGKAELFAASPNLEMLAMTTTTSASSTLFIYEQYTEQGGKRSQQSWSEWQFVDDESVVDIKFRRNELVVLVAKGNDLVVKTVPMYTRVTASPIEVHMDDMLILDTTGLTVDVPSGYDTTDCIAVRGAGTNDELWKVQFTRVGDTLTFSENIGIGQVYIGRTFISEYEPTRPFKYDEDGTTITTDKIRVSRWILSLVDTHALTMTKKSQYADDVSIVFESRFVDQYTLGTVKSYTGDWKFSFGEEASLATATFIVDNFLSCTISDVSWEGQYFKSKQRMA